MNKIDKILKNTLSEFENLNNAKSEIGVGGVMIFACVPTEDGKVSNHCMVLGESNSLVTTLAIVLKDVPELTPVFKRAIASAPLAALLAGLPEDLLKDLQS